MYIEELEDPPNQETCSTRRLHGHGGNRKQILTIHATVDPVHRNFDRT